MKDFAIKLVMVVLSVILVVKVLGTLPLSMNTKALDKDNNFFVSADATTYVKPDIAYVNLAVETTGNTAALAQTGLNGVINKVTSEVKKLGLTDEDVKTTNYNIYPTYSADGKKIDSYRASASIRVKERKLDRLNNVIDAGTAAGANSVSGVSFEVENKEEAINNARAEAIKKAKEKAKKIATESGISLGRIVNVSEAYPSNFMPYAASDMSFGKGAGGAGEQTNIQPGQTEVKVEVTLSYETL